MIVTLLYFILFIFILCKWKFFKHPFISSKFIVFVFTTKFLIGLGLFWVYSEYYPNKLKISKEEARTEADIFKFYDDSEIIYNALHERPADYFKILLSIKNDNNYFYNNYYINMNHWDSPYDTNLFNDSHTIIRFNAIIRIFSFGNYFVHILFFCMLSMIGLFALFKSVVNYFPKKEIILKWVLFFIPSVFFWSSGILKEPILLFSLGLIMLNVFNILNKKQKALNWIILLIMSILLFFVKFYVFFILIPLIIPFTINQIKNYKYPSIIYMSSLAIFILIALNLKSISPTFDFLNLLDKKQENFISETEFKNAGSYFELTNIEPNIVSVIKVIPEGLFNCFVKPLPWKVNSLIEIPPAIENFLIIVLLFISIFHVISRKTIKKISSLNFLIFCALFTLLIFIVIGITTPVSGALVRYKIAGLPFLFMFIILLTDFNFLTKKIK